MQNANEIWKYPFIDQKEEKEDNLHSDKIWKRDPVMRHG